MAELSIIVVTCDSLNFIKLCLDSIFTQDYRDFETIVVDNGSKDNTVSFIKGCYREVFLIENSQNHGASKARNQGIEASHGRWVLTLDCDVVLERGFLQKLMDFARDVDEDVGILQPRILKADRRNIYSCGVHLSPLRRFYDIGSERRDSGRFRVRRPIFGACSAAALYKRRMLDMLKEETGYFDERFFFLVEDVDLSWRAREKGYRVLPCPGALCYHSGGSFRLHPKARQYLCFRNRYYTLIKNETNIFALIIYLFIYDLPRLLYLFCVNYYVRDLLISGRNRVPYTAER